MKQTVFAVEDDAALREFYTCTLESEFDCRCFEDGESLFDALPGGQPGLILLDVMLPGEDGFAILSRLKSGKATARIPVIMVSAKDDEISKVKGLNMGADDYIAKPFGVLEFLARVKAGLRKNVKPETLAYKDVTADFSKHVITVNGSPIHTTLKEYNLFCFLCAGAEKVRGREEIFAEVWGGDFLGETRTLDIHIKELRKKLAEANSQVTIQTVRGVGYMLI